MGTVSTALRAEAFERYMLVSHEHSSELCSLAPRSLVPQSFAPHIELIAGRARE